MTYPHIIQTSDYESDDGSHSQWRADSPVRPMQEIEHAATDDELEGPLTSRSERRDSLPLTFDHLRALSVDDNRSSAQQQGDSTAVTVSSEVPGDLPGTPTDPIPDVLHESPAAVSEGIPDIEEPVAQTDEPTVVEQRPPPSPEALPPPYVSPPRTPPTASKEQYAFRSLVTPQNNVTEAAGPSSSESSANEESVPNTQPALAPEPERLAVPANSDTTELSPPSSRRYSFIPLIPPHQNSFP
jgi:hypothetical protein